MDLACLPRAAALAFADAHNSCWHPQAAHARYNELFAPSGDGGGLGACLALVEGALRQAEGGAVEQRAVLWVQEERACILSGRPYRPGLPASLRHRVIHVAAKTPKDALFALEEGLLCRDLACVIGEFAGNPRALDFTASRRLALAAEKHGGLLFLLRHDALADLSAARMRWQMRSAPSAPSRWDGTAPGAPRWQAQLFRARAHPPGEWLLESSAGQLETRASAGTEAKENPDSNPAQPEPAEGRAHG